MKSLPLLLWNFGKSARDGPFSSLVEIYPESVLQMVVACTTECDWRDVTVDDNVEVRAEFCLRIRPCCWSRLTMARPREGWEGMAMGGGGRGDGTGFVGELC